MDLSMTVAIVALVLGTTGPSSVSARNGQSSTAARLGGYIRREIRVTDAAGTKFRGTLIAVREGEIEVRTKSGTRTVDVDSIMRVERRGDSVKDGIGKGVLCGAAYMMLTGASPWGVALGAFDGGWIGVLIDALHRGWTPVYVRGETPSEPRR